MAADKFFVDTNVLVYTHDRAAGSKYRRALRLVDDLWVSRRGVLSTQVLQELCLNLRSKVTPTLPIEDVTQLIEDYLRWEIVVTGPTYPPGYEHRIAL